MEDWINIIGYEGRYLISDLGNVKSLITNKILKPYSDKDGYRVVILRKDNKSIHHRISRLVAINFIENPDNLEIVNHKDLVKTNDIKTNLEWSTVRENTSHAISDKKELPIGITKISENKFRARVEFEKKSIHCGYHKTIDDAVLAYNQKLQELKITNKYV